MKIYRSFLIKLFGSLIVAAIITALIMVPMIDHNSQQEFCVVTAKVSRSPDSTKPTYIRTERGYKKFDSNIDPYVGPFYIEREDSPYSVEESNWYSQKRPCKLRETTVRGAKRLFFISLMVSLIFTVLNSVVTR